MCIALLHPQILVTLVKGHIQRQETLTDGFKSLIHVDVYFYQIRTSQINKEISCYEPHG